MFLTRWSLFSSHVKKLCHMYHMQSRAGILPSSCYKKSRGFLLALCLLSLKCHFCLYTWQKLLEIHPLYTHSRQKEREGQGANEYMLAMSIISRKSTQQLLLTFHWPECYSMSPPFSRLQRSLGCQLFFQSQHVVTHIKTVVLLVRNRREWTFFRQIAISAILSLGYIKTHGVFCFIVIHFWNTISSLSPSSVDFAS